MPEKVIIMEIKDAYALAMKEGGGIVRIRRKEGMHPGDSVYILPEDYWLSPAKPIAFAPKAGSRPWIRRAAAMAAMLALVLILVLPMLPTKAYAVVSFDAGRGLQVQVDEDYRILNVTSCDGSIPPQELAALKGKNLMDMGTVIPELLGKGPILIACAPRDGQNVQQTETQLRSLFADEEVLYFSGNSEDLSQADASAKSLGRYLLSALAQQEHMPWLEDLFDAYYEDDEPDDSDEDDPRWKAYENLSGDALLQMLKEDPSLMKHEGFRELLADKLEDMHEQTKNPEPSATELPDDDDDDPDTDDDEDTDDQDDSDDWDDSEEPDDPEDSDDD